jgi:hypothetical protein
VLIVFAVIEAIKLVGLPYLPFSGPGDRKDEVRWILEKQVREMLKVTVLEITVVSDPSHPMVSRRNKGCVGEFCKGSYWAVFDWHAIVRMSYDLSTISPSYTSWMPPLTQAISQVWKLCLPPVAIDVELPADKVNYRMRRVGAFLDDQEAAKWEQEKFQEIRMHLSECYAQDASLRNRAQNVLKTKLDNALLSLRSEHNVIVNYSFADDPGERFCPRSFQRVTSAGGVSNEGLSSLPNCDLLLKALHAQ